MDRYDAMHAEHLSRLRQVGELGERFYCRHGGELKAVMSRAGVVEHTCARCGLVILQTLEEYQKQVAAIATDCGLFTTARQRSRR